MRASQLKERGLYREILRGAFEIMRRRRELWLLGLLAALLMINGGAFEFIIRAVYKIRSGAPFSGAVSYIQTALGAIASGDAVTQTSIFFALILTLAVLALGAIIAVAASGGLLYATARRVANKRAGLRESFAAGLRKLGPLFLTQSIGRLAIFCLFALMAIGVYTTTRAGTAVFVVLFLVFAVAALLITFLMMMTNAGIMIGGERWMNAVHDAFRFLKRHWLISLEMIAILFCASLAAALAAVVAISLLLAPFTLLLLAVSTLHSTLAAAAVNAVFQLATIGIILMAGAALAAFEHAAWGLLYIRLSDRGFAPKLERLWRALRSMKLHARFFKGKTTG